MPKPEPESKPGPKSTVDQLIDPALLKARYAEFLRIAQRPKPQRRQAILDLLRDVQHESQGEAPSPEQAKTAQMAQNETEYTHEINEGCKRDIKAEYEYLRSSCMLHALWFAIVLGAIAGVGVLFYQDSKAVLVTCCKMWGLVVTMHLIRKYFKTRRRALDLKRGFVNTTRGTTRRYCGKCGVENPDDNSFCYACGKPLTKAIHSSKRHSSATTT